MKTSARERHATTALETLRQNNQSGAAHKELLLARLEDAKARLEAAKEEQKQQERIIADIDRAGTELGREYCQQRTKLARGALAVIRDSSGIIHDRNLLWDVVAEYKLAHHETATTKREYTTLLQSIDARLCDAHATKTSVPILTLDRRMEYKESLYETSISYTDPTYNGLSFEESHDWYLTPQILTSRGDDKKITVDYHDGSYNTSSRWLLDDKEVESGGLDDVREKGGMNWRTDHVMGKVAICSYVQLFADGAARHDKELLQIGKALCRSTPELVTYIKDASSDVATTWSATALEALQNNRTPLTLPKAGELGENHSWLALLDEHDRESYRNIFATQLNLDRSLTDPYLTLLYMSTDSVGNQVIE